MVLGHLENPHQQSRWRAVSTFHSEWDEKGCRVLRTLLTLFLNPLNLSWQISQSIPLTGTDSTTI